MAISGNMSMIWKVTRNATTGLIESKPYQNLTTRNAKKWTFFQIDHNHYLVVANMGNRERAEKSRVYRWDRRKRLFISFQAIWTRGAQNWESFSIRGRGELVDNYLVVANSGKTKVLVFWPRCSLYVFWRSTTTSPVTTDLTFLWLVLWLLLSAPNPSFHGGTMVKVSKRTAMSETLRQTRIRQILVVV